MAIYHSKFNLNQVSALSNRNEMLALIDKLNKHLAESRFQGKEKHI